MSTGSVILRQYVQLKMEVDQVYRFLKFSSCIFLQLIESEETLRKDGVEDICKESIFALEAIMDEGFGAPCMHTYDSCAGTIERIFGERPYS